MSPFSASIKRIALLALLLSLVSLGPAQQKDPPPPTIAEKILQGAKRQVARKTRHIETYETLKYPMGDVDSALGVCTDLVIRAYRNAGIDLQKLLHEDRVKHPEAYPTHIWEYEKPDRNIDHRRCQNLVVFFSRFAKSVDKSDAKAWRPGDVVFFVRKGKKQPWHVAIVSDKKTAAGAPGICHSFPPRAQEGALMDYAPILSIHRWPESKVDSSASGQDPAPRPGPTR